MNKKNLLLTIALMLAVGFSFGQTSSEEFKPSGKVHVKIFTNFHSTFGDDTPTHNAFEIQRAYFGYGFNLTENISGNITLDVANPGAGKLNMTAYLKNAYFQYKKGNLTTQFGLITLQQFKVSESQWGGRYLYKSFQDQYKMGYSADLAFYTNYKFNKMVSADISISNGEGYKSVETDSTFKYSAGLTLNPVKGLTFRGYYDYMGDDASQQTMSFYLSYGVKNLNIAAEYNQQLNHNMVADETLSGYSFFGSYKLNKTRFFARYDKLMSIEIGDAVDPWNFAKDGDAYIVGVEFNVAKGLKITPNFQAWKPADGSSMVNIAYLSCEIKI